MNVLLGPVESPKLKPVGGQQVFGRRNRLRLPIRVKKPAEHVIQRFPCSLEPKHPLCEAGVLGWRGNEGIDPFGSDFRPGSDEGTLGVGLVLKSLPDSTSIDESEVELVDGGA